MGVEEIRAEIDAEKRLDLEQSIKYKQDLVSTAKGILKLHNNPSVQKWLAIFAEKPLETLESQHNTETDTNKSFILKGQVFRLKKQLNWVSAQKKHIENLENDLLKLREQQEGTTDE